MRLCKKQRFPKKVVALVRTCGEVQSWSETQSSWLVARLCCLLRLVVLGLMTRVRVRINGAAGGAVVVIGPDTTREDFINAAKMKLFSGFGGQVSGRLIDPRET